MTATVSASEIPFKDVHEFDGPFFYSAPNEETSVWRELIKGLKIDRAAGICSSGEVGFFAILPTVRKELVLVDHSYRSLSIAMLKYLLIRECGWVEAKRLLTGKSYAELNKQFQGFKKHLPKAVYNSFNDAETGRITDASYNHAYGSSWLRESRDHNEVSRVLAKEWSGTPSTLGKAASRKLDKISFMHGDMRDLAKNGPFDLFYGSNALGHAGRNSKSNSLYNTRYTPYKKLETLVKPGGYILLAESSFGKPVSRPGWETVRSIYTGKTHWTHTIYTTPV